MDCHKPSIANGKKRSAKGGLRLDSARGFMKGGQQGAAIIPFAPEKSPLYTLTTLGEDDEDVMPSKGELLTKREQARLFDWIQQGATFGTWHGSEAAPEKGWNNWRNLSTKTNIFIEKIEKRLAPLTKEEISLLEKANFTAWGLTPQNKALRIRLTLDQLDQQAMETLKRISKRCIQIEVHLGAHQKNGMSLKDILNIKFPSLMELKLHQLPLTTDELSLICQQAHLKTLNLYHIHLQKKHFTALQKRNSIETLILGNTSNFSHELHDLRKRWPDSHIISSSHLQ
jgi:hypothetical protein